VEFQRTVQQKREGRRNERLGRCRKPERALKIQHKIKEERC
jgi:hypothetical protein